MMGCGGIRNIDHEIIDELEQEIATLRQQLAAERQKSLDELAEWQTLANDFRIEARNLTAELAATKVALAEAQEDLDAERQKRCGTCEDWQYNRCVSAASSCRFGRGTPSGQWPADHGCPHWRGKEER